MNPSASYVITQTFSPSFGCRSSVLIQFIYTFNSNVNVLLVSFVSNKHVCDEVAHVINNNISTKVRNNRVVLCEFFDEDAAVVKKSDGLHHSA